MIILVIALIISIVLAVILLMIAMDTCEDIYFDLGIAFMVLSAVLLVIAIAVGINTEVDKPKYNLKEVTKTEIIATNSSITNDLGQVIEIDKDLSVYHGRCPSCYTGTNYYTGEYLYDPCLICTKCKSAFKQALQLIE